MDRKEILEITHEAEQKIFAILNALEESTECKVDLVYYSRDLKKVELTVKI